MKSRSFDHRPYYDQTPRGGQLAEDVAALQIGLHRAVSAVISFHRTICRTRHTYLSYHDVPPNQAFAPLPLVPVLGLFTVLRVLRLEYSLRLHYCTGVSGSVALD